MDQNRFDTVTRALAGVGNRRGVLRGVASAALGLAIARLPGAAAAKKKRKPRKGKPNDFGCFNVGAVCKNADQCCSGICGGKPGKKRCRAHDAGDCRGGQTIGFCGGTNVGCAIGGGNATGVCGTTTGNAAYCVGGGDCFACHKDVDCQPFCGAGAACVRCADCADTGGAMCASPGVLNCEFP